MAGEIGHYCGIDFIGGGVGAVDKIDGAVLQDKDVFLVVTPTVFAPLTLDDDSGAGESSPQIIAPNTNPGNKRWILAGGVFAGLTLYGNVVLSAGVTRTIGHAAGPLLTFDDTGDTLVIAGCKVGVGITPASNFHVGAGGVSGDIRITGKADNSVYGLFGYNNGNGTYIELTEEAVAVKVLISTFGDSYFLGGNVGFNDNAPASKVDVNGDINTTDVYKVDDVQVIQARVIDARCDDAINSGDATTDGVIDALRDAMITHGLIAAA